MFPRTQQPPSPAGSVAFGTPPPGEWTLVRVTDVFAGTPQTYGFEEWWLTGNGAFDAVTGGRRGTDKNPGYVLPDSALAEVTLAADDFAWARPARGAGGLFWELVPVAASAGSTPTLLCAVTVTDTGSGHTVKRQTYSAGITDSAGPVTFTRCRSTTGSALPVNTYVLLEPIPDAAGDYWITPAAYASFSLPGLLSAASQTLGGRKFFTDGLARANSSGTAGLYPGASQPLPVGIAAAPAAYAPTAPSGDYFQTETAAADSQTNTREGRTGGVREHWVVTDHQAGTGTNAGLLVLVGRYAYYEPNGGGGSERVHAGASGTVLSGATVKGGIVTDLGSTAGVLGLSGGGTGSNLSDPGHDAIIFWDDSGNATTWLTPDGSGVEISGTTLQLKNQGAAVVLNNSTGGSADGDLQAVSGTGDDANINDNFADLYRAVDELRTMLSNAGFLTLPP